MAGYRKLGRTSSQRKALLRNQVTDLLYHGKIRTTEAKAKEIRKIAEGLIALGVREKDNFNEVTVTRTSKDGETIEKVVKKDTPSRLHARRQMRKVLYTRKEIPATLAGRKANTKTVDLTDKLFGELADKYAGRNGGYTRIVKIGPRKGDAAMEVLIELV
jgi:large subunit ribosomal protein L17